MALPRTCTSLACRQHGIVTRRQLLALGRSPGEVDGWVRRELFELVADGVYRIPGSPRSGHQVVMAAVARAGRDARASGPTAGALFRIEGFDLRATPEIVVPRERRVRAVDFRVRRADVPPRDRTTVDGIPGVTPARALVDVAAEISSRALRVAVDSARQAGLLRVERLERCASAAAATAGGRRILRLVGSGALRQESEGERRFAVVIGRLDPPVEWQVEILSGVRPDALWRDAAMTFEYEGRDRHTGMVDLEHDLPRILAVERTGWDVTRITSGMLDDAERTLAAIQAKRQRRLRAFRLDPGSHPLAGRYPFGHA